VGEVAAIISGMHMPVRDPLGQLKAQETRFERIRCPHCHWHPDTSSRWCCDASDAPEPFFPGCRTEWNTFTTHGRCPGCGHQWLWTLCLRCVEWSLHEDWYEDDGAR
jgi:DNA-directed RNA polymerase subunit RPC12/RpoP